MSDAWDVAKEVGGGVLGGAGDMAGKVFGDGDDPGLLGLGQKDVKQHDIDPNAYKDPYSDQMRAQLAGQLSTYQSRTAPTSTAAQQTGIREYGGATVAPTSTASRVTLGPASTYGGATINRGEDQQVREGQMRLIGALQRQAAGEGPSLAGGMLRQGMDRNIKQQMAVAAAQGQNPLAQRSAALGTAQAQRQTAADAAQVKMQEQLNAQQQLGQALVSTRGMDLGVAQAQAGLLQQAGLTNRDALNQFALQQAGMDQQGNIFNAGQVNQTNALQAQLGQQAGLATQAQYNQMLAANTANQQQTNLANLQSQLQTMGMNDQQIRTILGMQLTQNEADRAALMAQQELAVKQATGIAGAEISAYDSAADARAEFVRNLTDQKVIGPQDYKGGK